MDRPELIEISEMMIEQYREVLLLDSFFKIDVEIRESKSCPYICRKDENSPLAWVIELSPNYHADAEAIQYSILESLLNILFCPIDAEQEKKAEVIARLATSYCALLSEEEVEEE